MVPQKNFFGGQNKCESTETNEKSRVLIRSHASMMTTVTKIVISVIIAITKNDNHNKNSNNNNNNNSTNNSNNN